MLDEFQEVVDIDARLPRLMRAVFQQQPEVAHVYLGSKRHMLRRMFSDENEPFWRSAKQMELGVIERGDVRRRSSSASSSAPGASSSDEAVARSSRSPAATPTRRRSSATSPGRRSAPRSAPRRRTSRPRWARCCAPSTPTSRLLWERASSVQRLLLAELAREPGRPLSGDYRNRHNLPGPSTVQRAVEALEREELVARDHGRVRIVEPFLAAWLLRDMRGT